MTSWNKGFKMPHGEIRCGILLRIVTFAVFPGEKGGIFMWYFAKACDIM